MDPLPPDAARVRHPTLGMSEPGGLRWCRRSADPAEIRAWAALAVGAMIQGDTLTVRVSAEYMEAELRREVSP